MTIGRAIQNNIVIISTLVIALMGGIPGGIQSYQYFFSKPKFDAQVHNVFKGFTTVKPFFGKSKAKKGFLLITLTISNTGNAKLLPSYFEASASSRFWDNKWFKLKPVKITHNFDLELENVVLESLEEYDLQVKATSILPGEAMHGHLLFTLDDAHPIVAPLLEKMKLTCVDVFNKKYSVQIDDLQITEEFLPKHGILPKDGLT